MTDPRPRGRPRLTYRTTLTRLHGALRGPVEALAASTGLTLGQQVAALATACEVVPWPSERRRLPLGCEPWAVELRAEAVERFGGRGRAPMDLSWSIAAALGILIPSSD